MHLLPEAIFGVFEEVKRLTDKFIADYRCADYMDTVRTRQTQLCAALVVEAFERLGTPLASAGAGIVLPRIKHQPEHGRLVEWLYRMLEHKARLIDVSANTGVIVRTALAVPVMSGDTILAKLLAAYPNHE